MKVLYVGGAQNGKYLESGENLQRELGLIKPGELKINYWEERHFEPLAYELERYELERYVLQGMAYQACNLMRTTEGRLVVTGEPRWYESTFYVLFGISERTDIERAWIRARVDGFKPRWLKRVGWHNCGREMRADSMYRSSMYDGGSPLRKVWVCDHCFAWEPR